MTREAIANKLYQEWIRFKIKQHELDPDYEVRLNELSATVQEQWYNLAAYIITHKSEIFYDREQSSNYVTPPAASNIQKTKLAG